MNGDTCSLWKGGNRLGRQPWASLDLRPVRTTSISVSGVGKNNLSAKGNSVLTILKCQWVNETKSSDQRHRVTINILPIRPAVGHTAFLNSPHDRMESTCSPFRKWWRFHRPMMWGSIAMMFDHEPRSIRATNIITIQMLIIDTCAKKKLFVPGLY